MPSLYRTPIITTTTTLLLILLLSTTTKITQCFHVPLTHLSHHHHHRTTTTLHESPSSDAPFFAIPVETPPSTTTTTPSSRGGKVITDKMEDDNINQMMTKDERQTRPLGGQELLMLPRQYSLTNDTFPPMSHTTLALLSHTPSLLHLRQSIATSLQTHPLLRSHISGDGEPSKRIDLFQMVREGNPTPESFVIGDVQVDDVLDVVTVVDGDLEEVARKRFEEGLDQGLDREGGSLWKLEFLTTRRPAAGDDSDNAAAAAAPCALLFRFNHAISDQSTANILLDEILQSLADDDYRPTPKSSIPKSLEEGLLGSKRGIASFTPRTVGYIASKALEGFKNPVILPDEASKTDRNPLLDALTTISGRVAGGTSQDDESSSSLDPPPEGCGGRRSTVTFRTFSNARKFAALCRENGVSVTNALSAAMTLVASDVISGSKDSKEVRNYKVLQSLDMRRFEEDNDSASTMSCHAGSMDLIFSDIPDHSSSKNFWKLAKSGKEQTNDFINKNYPEEAVRVFDAAMEISDMNNLVHLTAMSQSSMGRAYSAGITNNGVYERQTGGDDENVLKSEHGPYKIKNLYFATSHARTGCLYQLSALTINDELQLSFHPASPPVSPAVNERFADGMVDLLTSIMNEEDDKEMTTELPEVAKNIPMALASSYFIYALLSHATGWSSFFSELSLMKQSVPDDQFWPALNFWIFFAVGHPILQPILYLSDVLHSSPGWKVGDLVPATFLAGNVAFLSLLAYSKEIRNAINITLLSAFLAYVGAGLDGQAGLGDYNLALNDNYNKQIVKGCPAYDDVRQDSMKDFDLEKYQGKWYEQKFHDWTQFKEVYDTTLDIKLTSDGKGWTDDFAVKGPAPASATKSWDKSPVANGAHYFLFGRVDPKDPPGVLRESGFGVEFPNYIVDVKKDPSTGEYTEAIQFQCLERGGVRVFEGINYMSRKPQMTPEEMTAMHARAEKAGMNPYGAGVEQMHSVARRGLDEPPVDNEWQRMWKAIGLDRLLELLTESIEDGGR